MCAISVSSTADSLSTYQKKTTSFSRKIIPNFSKVASEDQNLPEENSNSTHSGIILAGNTLGYICVLAPKD